MKLILSIAALLGAHAASAAQQCPASLELQVPAMGAAENRTAQDYADCMSEPMLPSAQGRLGNLAACRANLPVRRSDALEMAVRQVEQAAINLGACQTRLRIKAQL